MKFKETVGIDVSKPFIDVFIHTLKKHKRFKNINKGFMEMIFWINKFVGNGNSQIQYAFEHTGLYSLPLSIFLTEKNISFILIPGLELKRSLGIVRGKDD